MTGEHMEQRKIGTLTLHHEPGEEEIAGLIAAVIEETSWILRDRWSLTIPEDCHLVLMTSWQQFFTKAAPPMYKFGLALSFPIWVWKVRALWPIAGGWTNRFGRRVAIGVKPPTLLAQADRRIGNAFSSGSMIRTKRYVRLPATSSPMPRPLAANRPCGLTQDWLPALWIISQATKPSGLTPSTSSQAGSKAPNRRGTASCG